MATSENLGRVRGAGVFYSSATSSTSVALSTITPNNISPLPGDSIIFNNGDIRTVQSVNSLNAICGDIQTNLISARVGKLKQIVTTSANFSTGDAPYIVTIEDADITSTSFIRVYPNDASTVSAFQNLTSKLINSYIGKFEFSLTSNAVTALNLTYEIVEVL